MIGDAFAKRNSATAHWLFPQVSYDFRPITPHHLKVPLRTAKFAPSHHFTCFLVRFPLVRNRAIQDWSETIGDRGLDAVAPRDCAHFIITGSLASRQISACSVPVTVAHFVAMPCSAMPCSAMPLHAIRGIGIDYVGVGRMLVPLTNDPTELMMTARLPKPINSSSSFGAFGLSAPVPAFSAFRKKSATCIECSI